MIRKEIWIFDSILRVRKARDRERIKQGLANSGYKPTGKKANIAKHNRIRELASQTNMTKEEIAKAVGAGVATVYRALKQGWERRCFKY